jgi:hypothetical protein
VLLSLEGCLLVGKAGDELAHQVGCNPVYKLRHSRRSVPLHHTLWSALRPSRLHPDLRFDNRVLLFATRRNGLMHGKALLQCAVIHRVSLSLLFECPHDTQPAMVLMTTSQKAVAEWGIAVCCMNMAASACGMFVYCFRQCNNVPKYRSTYSVTCIFVRHSMGISVTASLPGAFRDFLVTSVIETYIETGHGRFLLCWQCPVHFLVSLCRPYWYWTHETSSAYQLQGRIRDGVTAVELLVTLSGLACVFMGLVICILINLSSVVQLAAPAPLSIRDHLQLCPRNYLLICY